MLGKERRLFARVRSTLYTQWCCRGWTQPSNPWHHLPMIVLLRWMFVRTFSQFECSQAEALQTHSFFLTMHWTWPPSCHESLERCTWSHTELSRKVRSVPPPHQPNWHWWLHAVGASRPSTSCSQSISSAGSLEAVHPEPTQWKTLQFGLKCYRMASQRTLLNELFEQPQNIHHLALTLHGVLGRIRQVPRLQHNLPCAPFSTRHWDSSGCCPLFKDQCRHQVFQAYLQIPEHLLQKPRLPIECGLHMVASGLTRIVSKMKSMWHLTMWLQSIHVSIWWSHTALKTTYDKAPTEVQAVISFRIATAAKLILYPGIQLCHHFLLLFGQLRHGSKLNPKLSKNLRLRNQTCHGTW